MNQHELDTELETLMDSYSILAVLNSLERICREKADYVRSGGSHGEPSKYMANRWERLANRLDKAANDDIAGL